jgi:hypothetical protein
VVLAAGPVSAFMVVAVLASSQVEAAPISYLCKPARDHDGRVVNNPATNADGRLVIDPVAKTFGFFKEGRDVTPGKVLTNMYAIKDYTHVTTFLQTDAYYGFEDTYRWKELVEKQWAPVGGGTKCLLDRASGTLRCEIYLGPFPLISGAACVRADKGPGAPRSASRRPR